MLRETHKCGQGGSYRLYLAMLNLRKGTTGYRMNTPGQEQGPAPAHMTPTGMLSLAAPQAPWTPPQTRGRYKKRWPLYRARPVHGWTTFSRTNQYRQTCTVHLGLHELSGDREKPVRKTKVRETRGCNSKRSLKICENYQVFHTHQISKCHF